jgi:DNA-binding transcriptional LysR family regulator
VELRHLRYFVAVAEALSFRKAASRLSVSAAALSQQVGDLEDELGLKLFHRNSRRVELTEVGRVFLIRARRLLLSAQEAVAQAQEAAKGQRGRLVVGILGPVTVAFLPGVLSRFRGQHPLVEITVSHLNNRAQVEAVLNGSIMLGIGYYFSALEEDEQEQVSTRLVLRSPAVIVCPKNRRSSKRAVPKLKDFRHDKFLSIDPAYGFGYGEWLLGLCKRLGGFEPEIAALANSYESLIGMVAAGRGVFVGPEIAIRAREESWRSVCDYHLLTEPGSHFELSAIWKKQSQLEPTISKFIDLLVAELKSP